MADPYVNLVRNCFLTYIRGSLPHRLFRTSIDTDITFHLFDAQTEDGVHQLNNTYSASAALIPLALSPPTARGVVYMGDFNAQHPDFGDCFGSYNRLLSSIDMHQLMRWDTGGATHSMGRYNDLYIILTFGLITSQIH